MPESSVDVPRKPRWRSPLIALLIGVVMVQLIAMVLLMQSQVRSAEQRAALDTSSRVMAAQCFESATRRPLDACNTSGAPRIVTEVVDNAQPPKTAADDKNQAGVVPVGFSTPR